MAQLTDTDDVFTSLALLWEGRVTFDRYDTEIAALVRRTDPSLRLAWDNVDGVYWIGKIRTVAGTDLLVPLFPIGDHPLPSEVVEEIQSRDLRGRSKEVAKARMARMLKEQKDRDEESCQKFLPNFGEYSARIMQCDDTMTQDQLMLDMQKEVRRNR